MGHFTVKSLLLLSFNIRLTSAASHSLQYIYTAVTPGINFPEFSVVGLVDGDQIVYFDSNIRKIIPKTDWMEKNVGEDYWNRETQTLQGTQEIFKVDVDILMQRFNQTGGVHTVQWMYGCELHDDGTSIGYMQHGYDGEDYISLDLKTLTWTAANAKAVTTKQNLERTSEATFQTAYLDNICIEWLETYVEYGRSTLERKVSPEVSLFQKDSSSPVVCHATGFFPKAVMISWQKNGEDLHEDVELRETLPNQDGTFQKRSVLTVSPEELNRNEYTCVVHHGGLEKGMVLQVSDRRVLLDGGSVGGSVGIIIGVVVAVLLLVLSVCVGVFMWRKSGFKPAPSSSSSDAGSEQGSSSTRSMTGSDESLISS
ncbi:H-2 class I histocompatibility antigen, Q9 alpha chain-like [Colossoma macropomum]|uniref:H-2 class I histocompatibility antigen, Q9 alpha chain-like n=1 Tax=Colossoma macropomum TaxID=42526 RepID=UPI001863C248|nr:H-2 class I histocompatibility antigen, Q9 alpha chain-like [Colossoma macropomum]